MKTKLKSIGIFFLIIGVNCMLLIACSKTNSDYPVRGEFLLVNKTENQLELVFYKDGDMTRSDNIDVSGTLKLIVDSEGPKYLLPEDISFPVECDFVLVKTNKEVWKRYTKEDSSNKNNFLFTNNYKAERIGSAAFIYTYSFEKE